jgi:hypothetical protein
MTSISSAGSFAIPATQPARRQAESSDSVTETELTVQQEQQVQADDNQGRGTSGQVNSALATESDNQTPPSVVQTDNATSVGEQQKIEAAQQEAQRAEFDQQAGNVRETEPNAVRPPSSQSDSDQSESDQASAATAEVSPLQEDDPAIAIFNRLQNIDAPPRQGQELNQFA